MKYYHKDYANFIIDDETEKRIEEEKPKKIYSWYRDRVYNKAYMESMQRFAKQGIKIALLFAVLSFCYLILSISNYYFEDRNMPSFILHLLIGLGWGICAIGYYYSVKKARANELKNKGNTEI